MGEVLRGRVAQLLAAALAAELAGEPGDSPLAGWHVGLDVVLDRDLQEAYKARMCKIRNTHFLADFCEIPLE